MSKSGRWDEKSSERSESLGKSEIWKNSILISSGNFNILIYQEEILELKK